MLKEDKEWINKYYKRIAKNKDIVNWTWNFTPTFNGADLDEVDDKLKEDSTKENEKIPCNCPIEVLLSTGCQKKEEHF